MDHVITGYKHDATYVPKEIEEQELGGGLDALLRLLDEQNPIVIIKRTSGMDLVVVNTALVTQWSVTAEGDVHTQGHTSKGRD